MEEKLFVEWDNRYSVGIPAIDEQHKELFNLTNNLYSACLQGDKESGEYFKEVIRATVNYVRFHFTAEEKIMMRIQYPELEDHKRDHESFVKKVLDDVKAFEEGHNFVPNTFVRFLRDWVLTHIAVTDKKYAEYILNLKKRGLLRGTLTQV
ncbi:MAG: bacteriohemerythrin [Spirochaetaceae bacterium]|jgi:hemerythrin|nr:bacteriohemerythrin [Spirochaetaceae bacterium]